MLTPNMLHFQLQWPHLSFASIFQGQAFYKSRNSFCFIKSKLRFLFLLLHDGFPCHNSLMIMVKHLLRGPQELDF